ncbi:macrolide export ATP-binding/permease protein MacB [Thermacetogenium phaeum DSM 12270]|uniref:Macrolide export ATP-binding/permease protein MacB n=1 Tax=Thermacetogenium phaeum (strain ATCC BAA-254 / DSM 26808 / PB) TaxID=1089553 RepID=K4LJL3_THEPS|nr:ABC transporter ATP-binding protein [Thermacetogenium phaeum]AFV12242.1 macrolide export ATP-binding/permease protein MacB [Thermacetogenium phaeum DSM 12270]
MIRVSGLTKVYGSGDAAVEALKGVTLEIPEGDFVAIMGASGSGKSTFLSILGCLERPTAGSYFLDGRDVNSLEEEELAELRNRELGFVFQSFNLLPRHDVMRNVELPLVYAGVPRRERRERVIGLLKRVGLGHRLRHKPAALSGGEQQRVAIARALANNPRVVLADEPTGNLDTRSGREIMEIFREMHQAGKTIVLVTHDPEIAYYARRILHFRDGEIVGEEVVGL